MTDLVKHNRGFGASMLCGSYDARDSIFWETEPDSVSIKRGITTDFRRDKLLLFSRELKPNSKSLPVWVDDRSRFIGLSNNVADSLKEVRPFYSGDYSSVSPLPGFVEIAKKNQSYEGVRFSCDADAQDLSPFKYPFYQHTNFRCGGTTCGELPGSDTHCSFPSHFNPAPDSCNFAAWIAESYYLLVQNAVVNDSGYIDFSNAVVEVYMASPSGDAHLPNHRLFKYPDGPTNNKSYLHGYNGAIEPDTSWCLGHPGSFWGFDSHYYFVVGGIDGSIHLGWAVDVEYEGGSGGYNDPAVWPTPDSNKWFAGYAYNWSKSSFRYEPPADESGIIGTAVKLSLEMKPLYWGKINTPNDMLSLLGSHRLSASGGPCGHMLIPGTAFDLSANLVRRKYAMIRSKANGASAQCKEWYTDDPYTGAGHYEYTNITPRNLETMTSGYFPDYDFDMRITQLVPVKPVNRQ